MAALARAGGLCEFCGDPPDNGPLDVVHLGPDGDRIVSTIDLLRGAGDPLDLYQLAAAHRRCHAGYSSGRLPRPRRR